MKAVDIDGQWRPEGIREINQYLRRFGIEERLVRGSGYYYFIDGDAHNWRSSSVCCMWYDNLTFDGWLREWVSLAHEGKDHEERQAIFEKMCADDRGKQHGRRVAASRKTRPSILGIVAKVEDGISLADMVRDHCMKKIGGQS